MRPIWKKLYSEDGILIYEGYTINDKAYGAGTAFYRNGIPLHEGIFGIKGLLIGREYYPNGKIRFEGIYRLHKAYGPNWPQYGTYYDKDGNMLFHGEFRAKFGGVGYPLIVTPKDYGPTVFPTSLSNHVFMWADEQKLKDPINE